MVSPALFVGVFCGVLVGLNAAIALVVLLPQSVLLLSSHEGRSRLQYVAMSGVFWGVYGLFFGLLCISGLQVF